MEMYSRQSGSGLQKAIIIAGQVGLLLVSALILNRNGLWVVRPGMSIHSWAFLVLYGFNIVTFLRFLLTLFVFIRRTIPWEEVVSVIMAFALYYVGFLLLSLVSGRWTAISTVIGIALFLAGVLFNIVSEWQRHAWKQDPRHAGRLYTRGFFGISRHPNYFGDLLWVAGYAIVSGSLFSYLIPLALFAFFRFYNIPVQEKHLREKYGDDFHGYEKRVKSLIPFLL